MAVKNLGSVTRRAKQVADGKQVVYFNQSFSVEQYLLDVNYEFSPDKTYIVFLSSESGTIVVDGNNITIDVYNISGHLSSEPNLNQVVNGGGIFDDAGNHSYSIYMITDKTQKIYIRKPDKATVAQIIRYSIIEL